MNKLRSSTKILIWFVVLVGGAYTSWHFVSNAMIMGKKFTPIQPGVVNIVGINAGAGFRIVVANEIAQLVETQGGFQGSESEGGGATEGSIKKRIPIREMLGTLRGDSKAFSDFVMNINGMAENENWPPRRVLWKKADIQAAIAGDPVKRKQLEADLNVRLDGTPLSTLNFKSLEDGIIVVTPVSIDVSINGKPTKLTGEVMEPYKPRLIKDVEAAYADKPRVDNSVRAGYYREKAEAALAKPSGRENVQKSLERAISDSLAADRVVAPEKILRSAFIVINEQFISGARYSSYSANDGKRMFDLTVDLNEEGRGRLWQFSKNRVGDQLLLVADGIAIAAPHIQHELYAREFTIKQMPNEGLVRDAVSKMTSASKSSGSSSEKIN